jgi:hypothetical protein
MQVMRYLQWGLNCGAFEDRELLNVNRRRVVVTNLDARDAKVKPLCTCSSVSRRYRSAFSRSNLTVQTALYQRLNVYGTD